MSVFEDSVFISDLEKGEASGFSLFKSIIKMLLMAKEGVYRHLFDPHLVALISVPDRGEVRLIHHEGCGLVLLKTPSSGRQFR